MEKILDDNIPAPEALRLTADKIASDETSDLSEADRSLLSVVGNLGVFIQAQGKLNRIYDEKQGAHLSTDEYKEARSLKNERIIPFNHMLKEFINTHPNDELRIISNALANTYEKMFSRVDCLSPENETVSEVIDSDTVLEQLQSLLDGLRHEIAAESLLTAAGYEYSYETTVQDDATGSDLFVYLESGRQGIDIKSTRSGVERDRKKHRISKAVTTGLGWGDFTGMKGSTPGALSIPRSTAEAKAVAFIKNIQEMVTYNEAQRKATSRHTGRQGLKSAHQ